MSELLAQAEWLTRPDIQTIFAALDGDKQRTRAVGGSVRDTLMNRPVGDIDMATELVPDEVIARAKAAGIAFYPTGIEHGTVTLKCNATVVEVTTLRLDVETDGRHAIVQFGTDWRADAARRDFTINALYCSADGTLYDPLGGAPDAQQATVRFIGDPAQRIAEDGLRVYRFFRFSASHANQQLDPAGLAACANAAGKLDHISRERVGHEMVRMLALPKIAATLAAMAEIGLLPLNATMLKALDAYETLGGQSATTRLALIDTGLLKDLWRLSNDLMTAAAATQRAAILLADDKIGAAAYRHGEAAVEGLALAAAREGWGRARIAETARVLGALVVPPFPITGHDLAGLGITPGPALGQHLQRLEQLWIESGFALDKTQLLALVD